MVDAAMPSIGDLVTVKSQAGYGSIGERGDQSNLASLPRAQGTQRRRFVSVPELSVLWRPTTLRLAYLVNCFSQLGEFVARNGEGCG
jgi:hypothetical protein